MRSKGANAGPSMNRRNLLALGGGVAAAGTLAACGGPEEETAEEGGLDWDADAQQYVIEEEIASGEVPLKLWFENEDLANAQIAAFKEAFKDVYPDIAFEYELVAQNDAVSEMSLAGEAGNGGDVFMSFYDQVARAIEEGTAAPLGEYESVLKDRMAENFVSAVTGEDGQMYAVPVTTESIALMYNKTLLKSITGSDEPATTWEDVQAVAADYNDPASNRWTIRWVPGEIYYSYSVLSSMGWQAYPGGDVNEPGFDDPALAEALEYYKGLRGVWNVPSADATPETVEAEFAAGNTPYIITGPWAFSAFNTGAADNAFEYGVTPIPSAASGDPASSFAGMHVIAVSAYTKYPAAARVFANFLASDAGAAALYATTGQIPALNPDLLTGIAGLAEDPHVAGIVAQGAQADLFPQLPEYFWSTANEMTVAVWDDLSSASDAAAAAAAGYDELAGL
ncbi:extracellular solute-binding protein [Glycomyces harbinensis]|uniref:Arabinogalactan oligomer / maltooligosaccharide transport system substrate-binding protein n=1 Tax=Glycomyces harbinensis TaxID=58114 RepID=A0A1G6RQT9_9ACTN|nr:extracellular solute-binding protein [Glycomyces harbinensis]SDD06763.1 arabinogalactan oligomer / maltooligosaccharide transport system substrate-binding protein [Glycomyces harbinensis]